MKKISGTFGMHRARAGWNAGVNASVARYEPVRAVAQTNTCGVRVLNVNFVAMVTIKTQTRKYYQQSVNDPRRHKRIPASRKPNSENPVSAIECHGNEMHGPAARCRCGDDGAGRIPPVPIPFYERYEGDGEDEQRAY